MATALPAPRHDAILGSLLEESAAHQTGVTSTEPVPSLSSLLLSTAQDLATRSKQLGKINAAASSASAPKAKPPPAFALVANPQALLSSQASTDYLASLLAMPLPSLLALPNSLATLSTSLDTDLASLAFTRYSSFLLAHAATQSISQSFSTLSTSLDGFIDATDSLKQAVAGFEQRVSEPRRKRERMAVVRERMEEVEELMEAPSVVDACVRAGHWAEAIDVSVRLSELHTRLSKSASRSSDVDAHAGALLILGRIKDEVSVALLSLRARVLESLLQRTLKLPGAVRGVGVLRRIAERGLSTTASNNQAREMDEDSLRIVFLAARWRCLRSELENVEAQMAASGIRLPSGSGLPPDIRQDDSLVGAEENEERTRWVKRWIEVWREIVGETIGMYTEVFLSSTSLNTAIKSEAPLALPSTAPLALFLTTALSALSEVFSAAVPALTAPASLSSLLTQLSYCSHSFARHGLEFRELQQFRERVEVRVGRIIVGEWELAGRKWEKDWRDGWEGNLGSAVANARRNHLLGGRPPISDWLVLPEGLSQVFATALPPAEDAESLPADWHHQPPHALALLPPLAQFLNAHATALNSLRLLPPLSLYPSLLATQSHELDRATQVLAAFADAWLASVAAAAPLPSTPEDEWSTEERLTKQLREDEKRLVAFAVVAFGRWVLPWCEGGLKFGVYSELNKDESRSGLGLAKPSPRQKGVVDAIRRCEGILARIEGRPIEDAVQVNHGDGRETDSLIDAPAVALSVTEADLDPAVIETSTQLADQNIEDDGQTSNAKGNVEAQDDVALEAARQDPAPMTSTEPVIADDAEAEPAIEDLPVEEMPLVNPPSELQPVAAEDAQAAEPAIEIDTQEQKLDAEEDEDADGWGIGAEIEAPLEEEGGEGLL